MYLQTAMGQCTCVAIFVFSDSRSLGAASLGIVLARSQILFLNPGDDIDDDDSDTNVYDDDEDYDSLGPVYEHRLMMEHSGANRGYGYVRFTSGEVRGYC